MRNKKKEKFKLDVLAFGAHPDDIEFGCGGLLIKANKEGKKVGIIDLTGAELSTNGNVQTRQREARLAAEVIGAVLRDNLKMSDGFIFNSKKNQELIVETIRQYKPEMVLLPYFSDRHPDHENTGKLVKQSLFLAGLKKFMTGSAPFRPPYALMYMMWNEFVPSVVFNIEAEWQEKKKAMFAYESQFVLKRGRERTIDNKGDAEKFAEMRARNYGFYINKEYGEPYLSAYPIGLEKVFGFMTNNF